MAGGNRTLKLSLLADTTELAKGLNKADNDVQSFGDKLGKFGKVAGAAFAAAGAAAAAYAAKLAVDGVKAAIADEAAQAKLATTLQNVTKATTAQIAAVEDYITKTALATGVSDDQLRPSLDRLVRSTGSVTEAQKLQNLALNIAAGTGKDLGAVTEALGKAYDGNLGALKRLGVPLDESITKSKDFDAAQKALSATFEGQASKQADTFAGKLARLNVAFDEAKETVGAYILTAITPLVDGLVNNVIPRLSETATVIGEALQPAFEELSSFVRETVLPILSDIWTFITEDLAPELQKLADPILAQLAGAWDGMRKAVELTRQDFEKLIPKIQDVNRLLGIDLATILGNLIGSRIQPFTRQLESLGGGLRYFFATAVVQGVEFAVNSAIRALNGLIRAYNSIPFLPNVLSDGIAPIRIEVPDSLRTQLPGSAADLAAAQRAMSPAATGAIYVPSSLSSSTSGTTGGSSGGSRTGGSSTKTSTGSVADVAKIERVVDGLEAILAKLETAQTNLNVTVQGNLVDPEGAARAIQTLLIDSEYRVGNRLEVYAA